MGSGRKKRAHAKEVREKSILTLYNKLHELVSLLAELLNIQVLTDTAVLHASSMGVAPFFVESVSELQLSALKLVTTVSSEHDMHSVCSRNLFCFVPIVLSRALLEPHFRLIECQSAEQFFFILICVFLRHVLAIVYGCCQAVCTEL